MMLIGSMCVCVSSGGSILAFLAWYGGQAVTQGDNKEKRGLALIVLP